MPYTKDEGGKLNNFAREPMMYQAQAPSKKEKRNYIIFAILALLLVSGVMAVAVFASTAS